MIKLSTINQIVEAILDEALKQAYKEDTDRKSRAVLDKARITANKAVIYYKTAMICEDRGINEAMRYFTGTHSEYEYQEFRTSVVGGEDE